MRRWLRFSLRSFLLACVAISLLLAWKANRVYRQERAVATIRDWGGRVGYNRFFENGRLVEIESTAPRWLQSLLGEEHFRRVTFVWIESRWNQVIDENALRILEGLPDLRTLIVVSPVGDEELRTIGRLRRLESLILATTPTISDRGVEHLANLTNLKLLKIQDADLSDDSLRVVSRLPELRSLHLPLSRHINRRSARIGMPNAICDSNVPSKYTVAGLAQLSKLKNLEVLAIGGVADDGLEQIAKISRLQSLYVGGDFTDAGLAHLTALTQLRDMMFGYGTPLCADSLPVIGRIPGLWSLHSSGTGLTAREIIENAEHLASLRALTVDAFRSEEAELRAALPGSCQLTIRQPHHYRLVPQASNSSDMDSSGEVRLRDGMDIASDECDEANNATSSMLAATNRRSSGVSP